MRTRAGYREWANIPTGKPVNTIIPFEGQLQEDSNDRLFAVTEDGIYDITSDGTTAPTLVATFADQSLGAGFGTYCEFTTDNDENHLFYCDEVNGLWQYDEEGVAADTWVKITDPVGGPITGVDPETFAFVTVWKSRLWFIQRNSGLAWYLPVGSIAGQAHDFNLGNKFVYGGEAKAIYSWTIDGGDGMDDYFVACSRGGDVLVYRGTDPDLTPTDPLAFSMTGSYFIGEMPKSRKVGIEYGGELYLLSTLGVISLRQLLQGLMPTDPRVSPSAKINRVLREAMTEDKDSYIWAMHIFPGDGFWSILAPYNVQNRNNAIQYHQNLMTRGWGTWRGVPAISAETWSGRYLMGSPNGNVWIYEGGTDGRLISGLETGVEIQFDVLTSYQAPGGNAVRNKRVGHIRPIQIAAGTVVLNVRAVYDYQLSPAVPQALGATGSDGAKWGAPGTAESNLILESGDNMVAENLDNIVGEGSGVDTGGGRWDLDFWDSIPEPQSRMYGTLGQGRVVAVAMRGSTTSRLTFVGWDIAYTQGGFR
jgi:hypothetical protein